MRPLDAPFANALAALARDDVCYAEAWRRLIPIAEEIGRRRPSYWRVREFMAHERALLAAERSEAEWRKEAWDHVLRQVLAGRIPDPRL